MKSSCQFSHVSLLSSHCEVAASGAGYTSGGLDLFPPLLGHHSSSCLFTQHDVDSWMLYSFRRKKMPQARWLKATDTSCLTILEAGSQKSACRQGPAL